jgi:hypothetical protein
MKQLRMIFTLIMMIFILFACKDKVVTEEKNVAQLTNPAINCDEAEDKIKCEQMKRLSKSLKDLSQSDANKLVVTCDDKFRNEFGECEIPNHPYPKELNEKKIEKDKKKQ